MTAEGIIGKYSSSALYSINSFAFVVLSRASASTMKSTQIFSLLAAALFSTTTTLALPGGIGYDGRDDICADANGDFLCYDPNGSWPLGTTTCDAWSSADGTCSLGNISGSSGGGIGNMPADLEVPNTSLKPIINTPLKPIIKNP
jgi:hypothetical protein